MMRTNVISTLTAAAMLLAAQAAGQQSKPAQEKPEPAVPGGAAKQSGAPDKRAQDLAEKIARQALENTVNLVEKVIEPRYLSGDRANRVMLLLEKFKDGRSKVIWDPVLRVLILHGPPESVAMLERMFTRFDVPEAAPPAEEQSRNIAATVHMVLATQDAGSEPPVPRELESVIKQLRDVFSYSRYQLLDTLQIRMREGGEAQSSGIAPAQLLSGTGLGSNPPNAIFTLSLRSAGVSSQDGQPVIRFSRFHFNLKLPTPATGPAAAQASWHYLDVGIDTQVDIREGQKVVIGKANVGGSERALILVVTAEVAK